MQLNKFSVRGQTVNWKEQMGKVKYNKETKQYERDILINDIPTTLSFPEKKGLEELPYRLYSKIRIKKKNATNK